jgi:hypothetical protein
MGLRDQAAADLRVILEDTAAGFGWAIAVTDPNGNRADLKGFSNDVSQAIDANTGVVVSGRTASVVIALSSLASVGLDIPVGISERGRKPWLVEFNDITGATWRFKVIESLPDRGIGAVRCQLEAYQY